MRSYLFALVALTIFSGTAEGGLTEAVRKNSGDITGLSNTCYRLRTDLDKIGSLTAKYCSQAVKNENALTELVETNATLCNQRAERLAAENRFLLKLIRELTERVERLEKDRQTPR